MTKPAHTATEETSEGSPSHPLNIIKTGKNTSLLEASTDASIVALTDAIGYYFNDRVLLEHALTHSSVSKEKPDPFQRLEFLGDRILNFIVTDYLFTTHPHENEGRLDELSRGFVSNVNLAHVAGKINLMNYLKIDKRCSPLTRKKIAADACEALIGAIYKDGGLDAARRFIYKHFTLNALQDEPRSSLESSLTQATHAPQPLKTMLDIKLICEGSLKEKPAKHPSLKEFRKRCTYTNRPTVLYTATVNVNNMSFSAQGIGKKDVKKSVAKEAYEKITGTTVDKDHAIQLLASFSPSYSYEEMRQTPITTEASYNDMTEIGTGSSLKIAKKDASSKLYQRLYKLPSP